MSAALAHAPAQARPRPQELPRHVEIVTTATQRRARPRLAYALVGVIGLFSIFLGQLLLSIALSDGAYQISTLVAEQRDLSRTQQSLIEQLELAGSSQNLAANAEGLGMVSSTSPAYLRLSDGQVLGSVAAASAGGAGASTGVPNSLLVPAGQPFAGHTASSPTGTTSPASTTSTPESLPSPVTR